MPLDAAVGPVRVSQDGRYFVDRAGAPFFWLGDTQWELFQAFSVQDAASICESRKNKGFSVLQVMILGVGGGTKPNVQGEKPFVNDLVPLPGVFSNVPIYWINRRIWESPEVALGNDFNADVVPPLVADGQVMVYVQEGLWHLDIGDLKKYHAICSAYDAGTQAKLRKLA